MRLRKRLNLSNLSDWEWLKLSNLWDWEKDYKCLIYEIEKKAELV